MRFLLSAIAIAISSYALFPSALQAQVLNYTSAEEYEAQCRSGDHEACWVVGRWYKGGIKAPLDKAKARQLLKRSCALGNPKGCEEVRNLDREQALANPSGSLAFLDPDCRAGKTDSCLALAAVYSAGSNGVPKDPAKVRTYGSLACQSGHARACIGVAGMASQGEGGPVDLKAAIEASEKACSHFSGEGCRMAVQIAAGRMSPPDGQRAAKAADSGCSKKDAVSCMFLAKLYHEGQLVPKDSAKARQATVDACTLKSADGCRASIDLATSKMELAAGLQGLCNLKEADACVALGKMIEAGDGVPKSNFIAMRAYQAALRADPKHAEAQRLYDQVKAKPTK